MKAILIIGVGSIGERHLRCFQGTGRCKVAACEPNEALRQTIGTRYGCDTYASWQDALSSAQWDAAVICTPAHTHIPIATAWVEKGVPVLIEKPLSEPDSIGTPASHARRSIVELSTISRSKIF